MGRSNGVSFGSMGNGAVVGVAGGVAVPCGFETAVLAMGKMGIVLFGWSVYSSGNLLSVFEYSY